ncbi:Hint domain-containing protein [Pararhodobacter sp.]|uniref:Hint domain-containing protein n=1 Tax=Pararhodobacter sp. TaxID=2127056 RepID=UPI002AFF6DF8|nr:Hint domain-containing protein [Pararhodobacter sp.]
MRPSKPQTAHAVTVYAAPDLRVLSGANAGDPLPAPDDSVCGDYYRLEKDATPLTVVLDLAAGPGQGDAAGTLAPGSQLGQPGGSVHLLGRLSMMAPDGDLVEVLALSLAGAGCVALPLSPLLVKHTYTLIAVDPTPGPIRLADIVAGAFGRGTLIALANGRQVPVEELVPGDMVITRDHAVQPLRWKGAVRLRAEGGFAPVTVMSGVMGNPRPLTVSPHHRLFLYRRDARKLAGAAELLVQARHMVDGQTIVRREGGFVEYFSLVFDAHEVIYAEGVPCESLMVCPAVLTRLPDDMAAPLRDAFPGLSQREHTGADLQPELVSRLRDRAGAGIG